MQEYKYICHSSAGWLRILGSNKITEHLWKWIDWIWNETLKWRKKHHCKQENENIQYNKLDNI
jgi:hypothetical protein